MDEVRVARLDESIGVGADEVGPARRDLGVGRSPAQLGADLPFGDRPEALAGHHRDLSDRLVRSVCQRRGRGLVGRVVAGTSRRGLRGQRGGRTSGRVVVSGNRRLRRHRGLGATVVSGAAVASGATVVSAPVVSGAPAAATGSSSSSPAAARASPPPMMPTIRTMASTMSSGNGRDGGSAARRSASALAASIRRPRSSRDASRASALGTVGERLGIGHRRAEGTEVQVRGAIILDSTSRFPVRRSATDCLKPRTVDPCRPPRRPARCRARRRRRRATGTSIVRWNGPSAG